MNLITRLFRKPRATRHHFHAWLPLSIGRLNRPLRKKLIGFDLPAPSQIFTKIQ